MISTLFRQRKTLYVGSALAVVLAVSASGQTERHGRKYKALQPAANITLKVERASNGKPISNAAVIFHAARVGKNQGSLEVKTNSDGEAKIDIIEVGSHVSVQVIADGFATNSADFDVPGDEKTVLIKMEKPRAQVSVYQDNDGKASQRPAGVQEPPPLAKSKKSVPPTTGPNAAPASATPVAPQTSSPQ